MYNVPNRPNNLPIYLPSPTPFSRFDEKIESSKLVLTKIGQYRDDFIK